MRVRAAFSFPRRPKLFFHPLFFARVVEKKNGQRQQKAENEGKKKEREEERERDTQPPLPLFSPSVILPSLIISVLLSFFLFPFPFPFSFLFLFFSHHWARVMAELRERDVQACAEWIHNKLSGDAWSAGSVASLLTVDTLNNVSRCFATLETQVKHPRKGKMIALLFDNTPFQLCRRRRRRPSPSYLLSFSGEDQGALGAAVGTEAPARRVQGRHGESSASGGHRHGRMGPGRLPHCAHFSCAADCQLRVLGLGRLIRRPLRRADFAHP
jgi:hypothetical protein